MELSQFSSVANLRNSVLFIFHGRAYSRILNFSEDQLRSTEKATILWKWVMEHLLSAAALQAKRAKAKLSEDDDASNEVDKKAADRTPTMPSKNVRI